MIARLLGSRGLYGQASSAALQCPHRALERDTIGRNGTFTWRWTQFRHLSSHPGPAINVLSVSIDHGSRGAISLDLHQPTPTHNRGAAILYLPAGPILGFGIQDAADQAIIAELSVATDVPVAKLNYRAGKDAPFPVAIHDVLAGYDWLVCRLVRELEAAQDRQTGFPRIGVVGRLLGGGLAASVALTEAHSGSKAKVVAAVLEDPIVDWVVPDRAALLIRDQVTALEHSNSDPLTIRKNKRAKLTTEADTWHDAAQASFLSPKDLSQARASIFPSQNAYLDNFASPIHWLRTPGIQTTEDAARHLASTRTSSESNADSEADASEPAQPALQRKYRLAYPPRGSALTLPPLRLLSSRPSVLASQHDEFVACLRAAEVANYLGARGIRHGRHAVEEEDRPEEVAFIRQVSEDKFAVRVKEAAGMWAASTAEGWREEVRAAGQWLRQFLS